MSDSNRLLLSLLESKSYEFEPEENPSFHQMGWSRVEWSPTGEYLAASRGFTVSLIDPKTLKEIKALPYERESSIVSMSWKSNGQELAVCDHLGAYIWNLESGKARESPHLPESGFNSLTWSPKNNLIAGVYESHANFFVKVWNPENEKVFAEYTGNLHPTERVYWSNDGQFLAWYGLKGLITYDTKSLATKTIGYFDCEYTRYLSWSPNDDYIAISEDRNGVCIVEVKTGKIVDKLSDKAEKNLIAIDHRPVHWSKRSNWVSYVRYEDEIGFWTPSLF